MAASTDPRIPRSGDRIINLSVLIGGIIAVCSPFLEGAIKWADWKLGDWVNFSTQYQSVVENMTETALLYLAGQWMMRHIRKQDEDIDAEPTFEREPETRSVIDNISVTAPRT